MTTEQKMSLVEKFKSTYSSMHYKSPNSFTAMMRDFLDVIDGVEKQAAIETLAKAERIEYLSPQEGFDFLRKELGKHYENTEPIPSSEFERYLAICAQRGTFATYLTNFIDQMTPDQREIIAIQFDQNLFGTDKAMAERFRNANNTSHENN